MLQTLSRSPFPFSPIPCRLRARGPLATAPMEVLPLRPPPKINFPFAQFMEFKRLLYCFPKILSHLGPEPARAHFLFKWN